MASDEERRAAWRRWAREPLVLFALVGLALYAAQQWHARENDRYRIVVTADTLTGLRNAYASEFGELPPEEMMPRLVEDYVGNEVLYREALARGLDKGDEIVRRRLIQKVAFLEQDLDPLATPDDAVLHAWFDARKQDYAEPGRVTFSHVFFSADAGGADNARARAAALLAVLAPQVERASERGDAFPDLYDFARMGPDGARRTFGDGEMARALFTAPEGQWAGPFRSAWGWHLVRVSQAEAGRTPDFAEVRAKLAEDWAAEARQQANAKRLAELRGRYTVVRAE